MMAALAIWSLVLCLGAILVGAMTDEPWSAPLLATGIACTLALVAGALQHARRA